MITDSINNMQDIIDSRDVIERIEELESEQADLVEQLSNGEITESDMVEFDDDEGAELDALRKLADEASDYAPDWEHGATLIRDSYFTEYAQDLAEELGLVDDSAGWPSRCIDWEQAARELQMDYTAVEFDGITYWIR